MKFIREICFQLKKPKLSQSRKKSTNLLSDDEILIWEEPITFEVSKGEINKVYTSKNTHPQDVLNIKKSIVSLFQYRLEPMEVLEVSRSNAIKIRKKFKHTALLGIL